MSGFAEKLKELRLEKGLTLRELAKKTELSQSGIFQWENDLRVPNANAVIILAKFFEVSTDYILGLED